MRLGLSARRTRKVSAGGLQIGGGSPVSVQSMCNTDTRDVKATVDQIRRLEDAGCELIRVAVPDMEAASSLKRIRRAVRIPLAADIHFDYRLALEAVRQGADKIRINPGNIGGRAEVRKVAQACGEAGIPIRIGVNAGSLRALKKTPFPSWKPEKWAEKMAAEALSQAAMLEDEGFRDIVVSIKADDMRRTILANEMFASSSDIPLHLGITEAGSFLAGTVKSSLGIGLMLNSGIGDTIRVSLTEDPVMQVRAAYEILKALGLREYGPELISCPTCGRCQADIGGIMRELEKRIYSDRTLLSRSRGRRIAVMGCVVNGPGEARSADFGIAGGSGGRGVWIEKGKQVKVVKEKEWVNEIIRRIRGCR